MSEHSATKAGDGASTGGAPGSTGGSPTSDAGAPVGTGGAPVGRIGVITIAGSAGEVGVAGTGVTIGEATGCEASAGGASSNSSCSEVWGTPTSDPGYRGIRGTLDGQALSVDGKDIDVGIGFSFDAGPGETPADLGGYIPLPGMSLWLDDGCRARLTTPDDTTWHDLDVELSAVIMKPVADTSASGQPAWGHSLASGHLRLQGETKSGPIIIDADFYLDLGVGDPCAPPPPRVG